MAPEHASVELNKKKTKNTVFSSFLSMKQIEVGDQNSRVNLQLIDSLSPQSFEINEFYEFYYLIILRKWLPWKLQIL